MNPEDRREFIKKITKGMVYSAPVIASLAAPKPVMASHKPGHTKGDTGGGGTGGGKGMSAPATFAPAPAPSPGAIPPPGAR